MQATMDQPAYSVTRRPLDMEDYLNMVRRNVGWLIGPTLAALTIAVVVAYFWQDTYRSYASIRVVPPSVPEKFVPTNINVQMADRITQMQQTILSRSTLTNIIQTYDLYRQDRTKLPMEDVIENMLKSITVSSPQRLSGGQGNAASFTIAFSYYDRYLAQRVTRDLMNRFIDENMRERFRQSQQTTAFLKDQYESARLELAEIEKRVTQFKVSHAGQLPEQAMANFQQLGAIESRVSTLNSNITRVSQERLMLESELRATRERLNAILKLPYDSPTTGVSSPGAASTPSEIEQELARVDRDLGAMERALERMLEQYKESYPDVQRLKTRIATLKREKDSLLNRKLTVREPAAVAAAPSVAAVTRVNPQRAREVADIEAQITRLQGQIRAKELESERYTRDISDADRRSREVQSRIEVGPIGAAQLEQLTREHDMAKRRYDEMKAMLSKSQMATDVEDRKQGEMLEVLDLPYLPANPTAPNRPLIIGAGLVIGLIIGGCLVAVREIKDTSLKSLKDIQAYTRFNVLASVPLLENDLVIRRRKRLAIIGWTSAVLLSLVVMGVAVYFYYYVAAV